MRDVIYLFIDGMSESSYNNSSMELAKTPFIDKLVKKGRMGFYVPEIASNHYEPKTDIVIPYFFGMPPNINPGRAALELVDMGINLGFGMYCCAVEIVPKEYEDVKDWRDVPILDKNLYNEVLKNLILLAEKYNVRIYESGYNHRNNRFILMFEKSDIYDVFIRKAKELLLRYQKGARILDYRKIKLKLNSYKNSCDSILFLGWAKGSLRGAFKYLGAYCNPYNRPNNQYFAWQEFDRDCEDWLIPSLVNKAGKYSEFVLYTKESAFASRKGERLKKIESIQYMDKVLEKVVKYINKDLLVVVLSDHSADMNGYNNPIKNTCFMMSLYDKRGDSDLLSDIHFCEKEVVNSGIGTFKQKELINMIKRMRSK